MGVVIEGKQDQIFYTNRPLGILFPGEINYDYALLPILRPQAEILVIVHKHSLFHQEIIYRVCLFVLYH